MPNAEVRNTMIVDVSNKDSRTILQIFDSKKSQLINIFPKIYEEHIQNGIRSGQLKFIAKESYLAVIENTNQTPIYVYLTKNNSIPSIALGDTTKIKVAKINTETGIVECIEPGGNCVTRLANNFNVLHSDYLQLIDNEFKGLNLSEAVLNESYTIYETKHYIKVKPTKGIGQDFYILK